jgi:hypothetical protein
MGEDVVPGGFAEVERVAILGSLNRVGPGKAVGYLPLYTIIDVIQASPETLSAEAEARGLTAMRLGPEQCCIKSGALYVFDRDALASVLGEASDTLVEFWVPGTSNAFVECIAAHWFELDHPVYKTIRLAFGEAEA